MNRAAASLLLALSLTAVLPASFAAACPPDDSATPAAMRDVVNLRRLGPAGLKPLLEAYDRTPDAALATKIDAVAGQKDAAFSRLYWYTTLDEAKAAAKSEGKPILELRLLGKLTDVYSCANSRFFRTVLYANEGVSKLLRDRFICVWESERPVPVVTIDFGDGRTLKRTVTGNSAHYVLDSDGRVIDVAPGLMDPVTFTRIATAAADYAKPGPRVSHARYLAAQQDALLKDWQADAGEPNAEALQQQAAERAPDAGRAQSVAVGKMELEAPIVRAVSPESAQSLTQSIAVPAARRNAIAAEPAPDAGRAARLAEGKMMVEAPIVRAVSPESALSLNHSIDAADAARWNIIATRHLADAKLDANSTRLARKQMSGHDDAAVAATLASFQNLIAQDTVRNNYKLRRQILSWLAAAPARSPIALADLNTRVYAELFLTPATDPWLGLKPEGAYSALSDDACGTESRSDRVMR